MAFINKIGVGYDVQYNFLLKWSRRRGYQTKKLKSSCFIKHKNLNPAVL